MASNRSGFSRFLRCIFPLRIQTTFRSTTAGSTPPPLGRWSFAVMCPLAPEGSASYPVPVRRPAPLAPRFLQTPPHGNALALRSGRCDLLPPGLSPGSRCPCWAHTKEGGRKGRPYNGTELNNFKKLIKQHLNIQGPRARLRMPLESKGLFGFVFDTL